MAYKIIDIQGIGEAYAPKLIAIGIKTPDELLEACLTPAARKKVADKTGISGKFILKWANHADLFRISGIGPQYAELLEAENLAQRDPSEKEVTKWIEEAGKLEAKITY